MSQMNFPFPIVPEYTAIALAYRNAEYIAERVMPRTPVGSREFKYYQYTKHEMFTLPETRVGRKGSPTEVEFTASEQTATVSDFGLDDVIPYEDIESAPPAFNPLGRAVEGLTELLALGREVRVASMVQNAANYAAANKVTLSGTSQWSDFANSDPYAAIMAALEGMLVRPNIGIMSPEVWIKLRVHPKITAALAPASTGNSPNTNANGRPASLQAVADLFELNELLVGRAWVNSANINQAMALGRVWNKNVAFLHQNPAASVRGDKVTWGFTAEHGNRVAGSIPEPKVGLRGGTRVRAGETIKELLIASDAGYLFSNAVA